MSAGVGDGTTRRHEFFEVLALPGGDILSPPSVMPDETALRTWLLRHDARICRFVGRRAGWLLRYESAEDLAQGVRCRALAAAGAIPDTERGFVAWLLVLVRRHLSDRRDHWRAKRRHAGAVIRITSSGDPTGTAATGEPSSGRQGPRTVAEQRELLVLATRALATLPTRDQALVEWSVQGLPLREQAARLELGYEATQRAGLRAMERLRRAVATLAASERGASAARER